MGGSIVDDHINNNGRSDNTRRLYQLFENVLVRLELWIRLQNSYSPLGIFVLNHTCVFPLNFLSFFPIRIIVVIVFGPSTCICFFEVHSAFL